MTVEARAAGHDRRGSSGAARSMAVTTTMAARRTVADRAGLATSVGLYVLVAAVVAALWRAAAGASGGEIAGYSAVAITWYLFTSEAAICSLDLRLIEAVGSDIANGSVTTELLRPVSPLAVRMATTFGAALPRLVACTVVGAAVASHVAGAPPRPWALALAAPALVVAILCNVAAQHAVAAMSFWARDARSAWFLYQKVVFIVGGMLLPLEVLPDWLRGVAMALPFSAMAYVPARLASGHVEPMLLVVQAGWTVVLLAAATGAFAAGERRLLGTGG